MPSAAASPSTCRTPGRRPSRDSSPSPLRCAALSRAFFSAGRAKPRDAPTSPPTASPPLEGNTLKRRADTARPRRWPFSDSASRTSQKMPSQWRTGHCASSTVATWVPRTTSPRSWPQCGPWNAKTPTWSGSTSRERGRPKPSCGSSPQDAAQSPSTDSCNGGNTSNCCVSRKSASCRCSPNRTWPSPTNSRTMRPRDSQS